MTGPIPVIINGSAGTGHTEAECHDLKAIFADAGLDARILPAASGGDLERLARDALDENPQMVVVGGGDGTVSAVAAVLAGTGVPLGVLPLGTLNHFAKDLRLPLTVADAVRTIAEGCTAEVDVGEVNGRVFINNSSLGLDPHIVRHRESQQRRLGRGKWAAFFWATVTVLRRSPFLNVRVTAENDERRFRTPMVFIGNNEYVMEGFNVGSRERLDAGRLSFYVVHRAGRWRLLGLAVRALFGRLHQAKDFESTTAQSIEIETRHSRLYVSTDGEVNIMDTPLAYQTRPRSLRVVVPRGVA